MVEKSLVAGHRQASRFHCPEKLAMSCRRGHAHYQIADTTRYGHDPALRLPHVTGAFCSGFYCFAWQIGHGRVLLDRRNDDASSSGRLRALSWASRFTSSVTLAPGA